MNIIYISNLDGVFSRGVLEGILSTRSSSDFNWSIWFLPNSLNEQEFEKIFKQRTVDGLIVRGCSEKTLKLIQHLKIPTIFMRCTEEMGITHFNGPHIDDSQIAQIAANEFSFLNLDYWGFLNLDKISWSETRKKEFKKCAESNNANFCSLSISKENISNLTNIEQIGQWVAELPKPCGILACNDQVGLDLIHACEVLGIIVPNEVAVIGVDNDQLLCESTEPALSSIATNAQSIGRKAAIQLAQKLGLVNNKVSITPTPSKIFIRESSHYVDRSKLIYQKAIHFIEKEALSNIKVNDVAKACGLSRRGLERVFQESNLQGPAHFIREIKLKKIITLLETSSLNLARISYQSGFSDAAGLSNFVKRMTGHSPRYYRKDNS